VQRITARAKSLGSPRADLARLIHEHLRDCADSMQTAPSTPMSTFQSSTSPGNQPLVQLAMYGVVHWPFLTPSSEVLRVMQEKFHATAETSGSAKAIITDCTVLVIPTEIPDVH